LSFANFLNKRISPFSTTGRVLRLPLRMIPSWAVVPVFGGINRGYRWIAGSALASCWIGNFEEDHQVALSALARPGAVVYDIGANVGFYTLALARLVTPSGHVYAFEPDARNMHLLRRHLRMNRLQNVTIVQSAVSSASGLVPLEGEQGMARIAKQGNYLIPSVSLDQIVAQGNPIPSFIKMDVEGAEAMVLAGASEILARRQTSWLIATHSAALREQCLALFAQQGYEPRKLDFSKFDGQDFDFLALPREWHGDTLCQTPSLK
jgi:FkbM family methyltransferase